MSVEKMNQYKESKKTRKADIAKAKRKKKTVALIGRLVLALIVVALVAGLTITFVNIHKENVANRPNYDATSLLVSDLTGISESEAATETATK